MATRFYEARFFLNWLFLENLSQNATLFHRFLHTIAPIKGQQTLIVTKEN